MKTMREVLMEMPFTHRLTMDAPEELKKKLDNDTNQEMVGST